MIKKVTISQFKDGDKVDEFPMAHPDGLPEDNKTGESSSDTQPE